MSPAVDEPVAAPQPKRGPGRPRKVPLSESPPLPAGAGASGTPAVAPPRRNRPAMTPLWGLPSYPPVYRHPKSVDSESVYAALLKAVGGTAAALDAMLAEPTRAFLDVGREAFGFPGSLGTMRAVPDDRWVGFRCRECVTWWRKHAAEFPHRPQPGTA